MITHNPRVLILAPNEDVHAIAVAEKVREIGGIPEIFDSEMFPLETNASLKLTCADDIQFELARDNLKRTSYGGVWIRRPNAHKVSNEYQVDVRWFAISSARALFYGGLFAVAKIVVNPPARNAAIIHKPYQIALAARCGLSVPATLVTNDANEAREFVLFYNKCIYKTVATWSFDMKETRLIEGSDAGYLDKIQDCPVIFQKFIEGSKDVRVTVVGDRIFAAEVDLTVSDSPHVDGRFAAKTNIDSHRLPTDLEKKLLRFHNEAGLIYGAYDFRLSLDEKYVFLEVNPDGQYLFVEIETDQPVSLALARVLCGIPV